MMNKMGRGKYPQTPHLMFSETVNSDDVYMNGTLEFFKPGKKAVVTEKMDGENTTFYRDGYHARSVDSRFHPSRSFVAQLHGAICYKIPENMRIILENVYAEHSIRYEALESFVFGIGVVENINGVNVFLDWDDTLNVFSDLGITPVPVLHVGEVTTKSLEGIFREQDHSRSEGIVVRSFDSFAESDFSLNVAKSVRANHVQTDMHWMRSCRPNSMK